MLSVPFATTDIHGGFAAGRGAICVDGDDLLIEVQVTVMNLWQRDAKTFRFDLTDLEEVRLKRGLFGDRITLRTRPMGLIAQVPGAAEGCLVLKVKRRHRADVDALLDRLDLWLA